MKAICVDSGLLIALYDKNDFNHPKANEYFTMYFEENRNQLLLPWPILYETISTRMVRRQDRMTRLIRDWKVLKNRQQLEWLDDSKYRQQALDEYDVESKKLRWHYRALSFTDRVIRNMLSDFTLQIHAFITFNAPDFEDVCKKRNQQVIS